MNVTATEARGMRMSQTAAPSAYDCTRNESALSTKGHGVAMGAGFPQLDAGQWEYLAVHPSGIRSQWRQSNRHSLANAVALE